MCEGIPENLKNKLCRNQRIACVCFLSAVTLLCWLWCHRNMPESIKVLNKLGCVPFWWMGQAVLYSSPSCAHVSLSLAVLFWRCAPITSQNEDPRSRLVKNVNSYPECRLHSLFQMMVRPVGLISGFLHDHGDDVNFAEVCTKQACSFSFREWFVGWCTALISLWFGSYSNKLCSLLSMLMHF